MPLPVPARPLVGVSSQKFQFPAMAPSAGHFFFLGVLLLLVADARAQNGSTIEINFIAANGPVVVGKFLQFTTLLRNSGPGSFNGTNATVPFNGTLTVTCSDAYLFNINYTLASPGCNEQVTIPPYAVGTPLNETYPGCDVTPQGLVNLNSSTGPVLYPTTVTADGHTATWTNVILTPNNITALPVVGRIQYQQPILCLATFGPSNPLNANSSILNAPLGVNGTSSNSLQKGTIFNNILQPPNPPPNPPPPNPPPPNPPPPNPPPPANPPPANPPPANPPPANPPPARPPPIANVTAPIVSNSTGNATAAPRTNSTGNATAAPGPSSPGNATAAPGPSASGNATAAPSTNPPGNATAAPNPTPAPGPTSAPTPTPSPSATAAGPTAAPTPTDTLPPPPPEGT